MSRHANLPHSVITINATDTFNNGSVAFTDVSTLADGVVTFVTPQGASLSAAQLAAAKEFEILKVQKNAAGTVTGFQRTLRPITRTSVRSITMVPVSTGRNQVVNVSNSSLSCNTDYLLKVALVNAGKYTEFGFNGQNKLYSLNSGCCAPCEGCGEGDCQQFYIDLQDAINADPDGLISATLKAPDAAAVSDDALTDEEVLALGSGVCPVLQLEILPGAVASFCDIPDVYDYPNFVTATVSGLGGFECDSTITVMQNACPARTTGTDVREQQFKFEGFYQGSIVRRADRGERFQAAGQADADPAINYVAFTIEWDGVTESGFQTYQDPGATTIYVDVALFDGGEPGTLLAAYLDTAFGSSFTGVTKTAACSTTVEVNP